MANGGAVRRMISQLTGINIHVVERVCRALASRRLLPVRGRGPHAVAYSREHIARVLIGLSCERRNSCADDVAIVSLRLAESAAKPFFDIGAPFVTVLMEAIGQPRLAAKIHKIEIESETGISRVWFDGSPAICFVGVGRSIDGWRTFTFTGALLWHLARSLSADDPATHLKRAA